jgi:hypothetical protein
MPHPSSALRLGCCAVLIVAASAAPAAPLPDPPVLRGWIEEFKQSPKGPFDQIRWFCNDGSVHPARPYPCGGERGGGIQHGDWSERALALREGGYAIGNVLAELEANEFVGRRAELDTLKQILIERFLIGWDDGWIFRGARSYRGAFQIEDEEAGARRALLAMLGDPAWRDASRFFLLREAVRLLPLPSDVQSAAAVRQLALAIAERDPGFMSLRAKIHNVPDAADAARVREYAAARGRAALADDYARLAADIDALYASQAAADGALALAGKVGHEPLAVALRDLGGQLTSEPDPARRLARSARLSGLLRKHFEAVRDPAIALELLQTSLALESEVFTSGNAVLARIGPLSRAERIELLDYTAEGLYGAGLINVRQLQGIKATRQRLAAGAPSLNAYRDELRYLARAPEWCGRWLEFNFGAQVARLAPLEPEAHLFPQDRLRGSPLLFYGAVIDGLVLDANRLAGIEHELFGSRVGAGLRALNPGLARGVLRTADEGLEQVEREGIYLLPETTSDLPAVAGILTRGEGSSLSHVQLLARNLGIPNVVVGEELIPEVREQTGQQAVLAVSPNGVVQLDRDGPRWDPIFGREEQLAQNVVIRPDLAKLDTRSAEFVSLAQIRASDSGRTSGPKGANLGELKHYFGDRVPNGFVIPFGAFRALLDRPLEPGGPAVFEWMKQRYAEIARASADPERQQRLASDLLTRLRAWIETTDPGPEFRARLARALREQFGAGDGYGVFVRSDTNVEDLPGFTGAGLNLTVPNVVGEQAILTSIQRVWASPFTERSYGWRQANMEDPEYVFPAVVVQLGFPAEKSGVMVTADVESGQPGWLSVAVSEGVGGAVEGQAAEALRIHEQTGEVRYLAQATAPERMVLDPMGGIAKLPATGTDTVLQPAEIAQLIALAKDVRARFVSLRDEAGRPMPADIEFAFRGGRLALLQIRPFVESRRAQGSAYLAQLDAGFRERGRAPVPLDGVPQSSR